MSDRFDFEQKIMNCWSVIEDINTLQSRCVTSNMSTREIQKILTGIVSLYQMKFEDMFETFEELIDDGAFPAKSVPNTMNQVIKNEFKDLSIRGEK